MIYPPWLRYGAAGDLKTGQIEHGRSEN